MSARERKPAPRGSRIPALIAALALTGPMIAAADPRDAGSHPRDAGDASTSDGGAPASGEGLVQIDGREMYRGLTIDDQPRDELLKSEPFALPAGAHTIRITRSDGTAYDVRLTVQAGVTAVVPRSECQPLGGAPPPNEPRPSGCCGGGATSNETAGRYGMLATAAMAIAVVRRRKRDG